MINLENSIIETPTFEKKAELKLPKEVSKWHDEIMNKFQEEVNYLPPGYSTELRIGNFNNKGVTEGAIVVWNGKKTINFPVLVNNYNLKPFDVIRLDGDDENNFLPADKDIVLSMLQNNTLGTSSRYYPLNTGLSDIKSPGGIQPKQPTYVDTGNNEFFKRACSHITDDQIEMFKEEIKPDGVKLAFYGNTGNMIDVIEKEMNSIYAKPKNATPLNIDSLVGTIVPQQMNNIVDNTMLDPANYAPISPEKGKVVTLHIRSYPTIENFYSFDELSTNMIANSKSGNPVTGVLLKKLDTRDLDDYTNTTDIKSSMSSKKEKDYTGDMFLALSGKLYSTSYNDENPEYFGKVMPNEIYPALKLLEDNSSGDFLNVNPDNKGNHANRGFVTMQNLNQGFNNRKKYLKDSTYEKRLVVVTKDQDGGWIAIQTKGPFRRILINDESVYTNDEIMFIPHRNISFVQRISNPALNSEYDFVASKTSKTYAVPKDTLFINVGRTVKVNPEEFVRPESSVRDSIKITIKTASIKCNPGCDGYLIESDCLDNLYKVANIDKNKPLNSEETIKCLEVIGVSEKNACSAMETAIQNAAKGNMDNVVIYGVNNNYINTAPLNKIAKSGEFENLIQKYIDESLNFNTIKIASILSDPESMEKVLGISFINKENLKSFVESLSEFEDVRNKLAKMLQASRLGLKDVEEEACKRAMDSLGTCIKNLQNIKMAIDT